MNNVLLSAGLWCRLFKKCVSKIILNMMEEKQQEEIVNNLLQNEKYSSLSALVTHLHTLLYRDLHKSDSIVSDLIDSEFLEEIKTLLSQRDIQLCFGRSIRDIKCLLTDESGSREHDIFIQYKGPKKLCVSQVTLPHSSLQDREYSSIVDIVNSFEQHINSLSRFFYELERIDLFCTVMEPAKPSFRDDYRRILLDERTWLHVEVTPKGFAANIHLLGQSEQWHDKLQSGLLNWDHDKDIVENITTVFDIMNFPTRQKSPSLLEGTDMSDEVVCSICLCSELPDISAVPQPLCQNPQCVVYFHRSCLYQWLVACSGGRPPAFGVAAGSCPTCLQPTTCSENNN